jgi:predicted PurR-regulated permease PerM
MSYIKPKLTEPKIVKLITDKIKLKNEKISLTNQINQDDIITPPKKFHNKLLDYLLNLLKKNIIFIIIFILIIVLLYVRYIETQKRKKQIKELLKHVDDD